MHFDDKNEKFSNCVTSPVCFFFSEGFFDAIRQSYCCVSLCRLLYFIKAIFFFFVFFFFFFVFFFFFFFFFVVFLERLFGFDGLVRGFKVLFHYFPLFFVENLILSNWTNFSKSFSLFFLFFSFLFLFGFVSHFSLSLSVSGALFSAAWFILISGIINANQQIAVGSAPFMWYYSLPAVFCSITNVLMNLVSAAQLNSRGGVFDDGGNKKAVVWFILMLAGSIACIGGAIWVLAVNYGAGSVGSEWPGVSLLLNTCLVTVSGLLFFFGRPKNIYGSY